MQWLHYSIVFLLFYSSREQMGGVVKYESSPVEVSLLSDIRGKSEKLSEEIVTNENRPTHFW